MAVGPSADNKTCYLHDELLLWDAALLVVSVTGQLLYKQTGHTQAGSSCSRFITTSQNVSERLRSVSCFSRDELGVEDVGILQAALLQVNCRHALHLHAGAEVAPRCDVLVDLHAASHLPQRPDTLCGRQRHVGVVWLCRQLLLLNTNTQFR